MIKKWFANKKIYYLTVEILLIMVIIFVASQLDFIFKPIGLFISSIFIPVLLSGFLFYLLNPFVNFLTNKCKMPRGLSALTVLLVLFFILGEVLYYVVPQISHQVEQLLANLPDDLRDLQHYLVNLSHRRSRPKWMKYVNVQTFSNQLENFLNNKLQGLVSTLTSSIGDVINTITTIAVTLVTVPFMVFYMLKDSDKLLPAINNYVPQKYASQIEELLCQMSKTIAKYITGQVIECLFVGSFLCLGYWLVGIDYALVIGIFAGAMIVIPYLGPYLGLVPALLVALPDGMEKALLVILVCIIVQQLDGNLVYPNVIGKSLSIHPLTIIILLLAAGNLFGLVGMVLAVPVYAVTKTVIRYFYGIYQLRLKTDEAKADV